jgi:thymidylate synthase (FAD)
MHILTSDPIVAPVADMALCPQGWDVVMQWLAARRPECLPEDWRPGAGIEALFPHDLSGDDGASLSGNELLVEAAGRKCYDSWGRRAGRKSNAEYIAHTQEGAVPHASILYHAKMSFFIAGVSRRVSHELIRNYVGADRDEEGAPSQESTRYTHHYGYYVAHPQILDKPDELLEFQSAMQQNYSTYKGYIQRMEQAYMAAHDGAEPKGLERKRIYESASPYLSHACETSWIWTTNPMALAKLFRERGHEAADLEFQRLARVWAKLCVELWPNLFPQPWVTALARSTENP